MAPNNYTSIFRQRPYLYVFLFCCFMSRKATGTVWEETNGGRHCVVGRRVKVLRCQSNGTVYHKKYTIATAVQTDYQILL